MNRAGVLRNLVALTTFTSLALVALAQSPPDREPQIKRATDLVEERPPRDSESAQDTRAALPELFSILDGVQPQQVTVLAGTSMAAAKTSPALASASVGRLAYANSLGQFVLPMPANQLVADDITVNAPNRCALRYYQVQVSLQADPAGVCGPVTAELALFDTCPQAGGEMILGTQAFVTFSAADVATNPLATVVVAIPAGVEVPIRPTMWLGIRFDRDNAGVVVGTPARMGYSADVVDYPLIPCRGHLGTWPAAPHGSFNAQLYVSSECPAAFPGYRNIDPVGEGPSHGAGVRFADDIELHVESCEVIGYEIGARGTAAYRVDLRTDRDGLPEEVVPGSENTFITIGNDAQILRLPVDPPQQLSGSPNRMWISLMPNSTTGKWIRTQNRERIGATADTFAVETEPGIWEIRTEEDGEEGAYHATIMCAGEPPSGACCDMLIRDEQRGVVCRELPKMNCSWPPPDSKLQPPWMQGRACEPDPFPHPCGQSACCKPDDTCENLTQNECDPLWPFHPAGQWQRGQYCHEGFQVCPIAACLGRNGPCTLPHDDRGCEHPDCCTAVCEADYFCCSVEWDRACVELTDMLCPLRPENDVCAPSGPLDGATLVELPGTVGTPASHAQTEETDPGFCCHSGFDPVCNGGERDGLVCTTDEDCDGGSCPPRQAMPDAQGYGTTWYKFVATFTSAELTADYSDPPADDVLLQVFRVEDPTSEGTVCNSLTPIACLDDVADVDFGNTVPTVCVDDLVPGDTYYVMLAAKTRDDLGLHRLTINAPCTPRFLAPNDACERATPADDGSLPFDLRWSTIECPIVECGAVLRGDIWFEYMPDSTGETTLRVCDDAFLYDPRPLTAAVYEDCNCPPDPASLVVCDSAGTYRCDEDSALAFEAKQGACYKIRLGTERTTSSSGEVCIGCQYCPGGADLYWLSPRTNIVDARRPTTPTDPTALEGIDSLRVGAPFGDTACWQFCETRFNPLLHPPYPPELENNAIIEIERPSEGASTLYLARPLTPGETTTVTYRDQGGNEQTGRFTFHPGDVNGDTIADGNDVLALSVFISHHCLGDSCFGEPYWLERHQRDINRDGRTDYRDLLELIDLLNGAGAYERWLGSRVPADTTKCP